MGPRPASNETLWTLGGLILVVFGAIGAVYICAIFFTS